MKDGKINNCYQTAYIKRYTLTEGKENGLKVIELDNGIIRVLLNESKGLDIMQIFHKGTNISFVSKNGFTYRETPFFNRFEGGMLYTCGVDTMGFRDNCIPHGTYHNIPAKIVSVYSDDEILEVKGEIEDSALYGKNLLMTRTITVYNNTGKVALHDSLLNKGTKTEDYCILYHTNLGYPMLDKGVKIIQDVDNVQPTNDVAERNLATYTTFNDAIVNGGEACYYMNNKTNSVSVVNEKLGKKFTLSYSKETLPLLLQWHSAVAGDYALGIEPCTSKLGNNIEFCKINPEQNIEFDLVIEMEEI